MSKSTEAAAIQFARDTQNAINNVDRRDNIDLQNVNQSADRLALLINEEAETSLNDGFQTPPNEDTETSPNDAMSFTPQTRRNLERAHKRINTINRQTAKIETNNEEITQLKQERDDPETSLSRHVEIDSEISMIREIKHVKEANNAQREIIRNLKHELMNSEISL